MLYKDQCPVYALEYAKNKMLVTGSKLYLVIDWSSVKRILNPNTAITHMNYAFTMPQFDEKEFPFIFVVGLQCISILNIDTLELKQLTVGQTHSGRKGLRFAFALGDLSEIQLHFTLTIQDKEGYGRNLVQYSYISLHKDAIQCLKERGRLPALLKSEMRYEVDRAIEMEKKVE